MPADDMIPSEDEGIVTGPDASGDDAEQFEDLMANYLDSMGELEIGQVAHARVVGVKKDYVLVDVGDKAEGVVDIKEFTDFRGNINIAVGDEVDVVVQSRDSQSGQIKVSHRQAKQRVNWDHLVEAFENGYSVRGQVLRALKNGLLVGHLPACGRVGRGSGRGGKCEERHVSSKKTYFCPLLADFV